MNALLALFLRSLRVETRSFLTYALRCTLGLAVLVVIIATHQNTGWSGAPGLKIFTAVISLDVFVISLAGLSYFASAVAEEKDEMTLGLLRMTNLSPLSILLGKSTSRLTGALLLLAAQVPFTLLAVALGGLTAPQVVAGYACLGAYLFLLANLSLVFSVVASRTSSATFFAGCAVVVFWAGPAVIKGVHWVLGRLTLIASPAPGASLAAFLDGWWQATPAPRLMQVVQTGFHDGPWCPQVAVSLVLGAGFFLLAWVLFNIGADRAADPEPRRPLVPIAKASRKGGRGRRAWRHALMWKDFHFLSGGMIAFAAKCAVCLAIAALFAWRDLFTPAASQPSTPLTFFSYITLIFRNRSGPPWLNFGDSLTTWNGFFLWLELAFAASRVFRLERRWLTLPSLATLPMSMHRIAWQKVLGCLLGALPWIVFVVFGCAFKLPYWLRDLLQTPGASGNLNPSAQWLTIWSTVLPYLGVLLLFHVILALSLRLKWGSLPLGFVCYYLGQALMMILAMLIFQQAGFAIAAVIQASAMVALYVHIGRRLEELAAED
jgi:hypothetical protein